MSGTRLPASFAGINVVYGGNPGGSGLPVASDVAYGLSTVNGISRALNQSGAAAVVKATAGRLCRVWIITSAANATSFNDSATTGGVAAGNLLFTIPASAAVGVIYHIDVPFTSGLVITPGASCVVAFTYS